MEKRRSPRSSKSPGGTAIFPKSPLVYESYKSGCGWKLINFFDFRHVKSGNNKRLSSEKRDSAGNVYTKSQLDLLKRLHDKCQCNDRIVEGENSCKPKTRRRSFSSEREDVNYETKPVQGLLERELKRIKNQKEGLDTRNQSSSSETELRNDKDLNNAEINLQVCVNEGKDRSKQFMEALDILSSNKELFITLLQDPDSFSVKKEGSKVKDKSLLASDHLDDIVLLKPRLSSSVDDRAYLKFKHLARKLKLAVGTNKEPECRGKAIESEAAAFRRSDVSTNTVGYRSPESPVFKRKKRVESDVFKLSMEKDVLPRRFIVERQHERSSSSSPVYEVPNALSSLQIKLKERRQKLEKIRESFKLGSLDKNFDVFDPNPDNSTSSTEYRSLRFTEDRYLESSSAESNSSVERRYSNIHEQDQPSPVSVLERIHSEDMNTSKLEERIKLLSFDEDSVHEFVKRILEASRLNWTNLMERCNEETSLLDEFSHGNNNHNKNELLLVLDYTDEVLREIYRQDIKFWPFRKKSRVAEDLIQETMRCFDWSLLCSNSVNTLDQIIESDMMKQCLWLDCNGESEGVVSDVVEKILQQLLLEITHELRTMQKGYYVD